MSPLIRFICYVVITFVGSMTALRFVFWSVFGESQADVHASELRHAFYLGLKFDLRCALLIAAPLVALGWIRIFDPAANTKARQAWPIYFSACTFLLLLTYAVDFGHFGYLASRLDASALRFLQNPYESFGVIWAGYPIVTGSVVIIAGTFAMHRLLRYLLARVYASSRDRLHRAGRFALNTVFAALFLAGIYGKASYYPLRWSDAFSSSNSFVSALALNPVLYFADTLKNRELQYDVGKVRDSYEVMTAFLGVDRPNADELIFERPTDQAGGPAPRRLNVVIMMLESNASHKTGIFGNPLKPSPNFDELASNGAYFPRFYAPHIGTARAVFASFVGLPDIELNKTSSRNPLIVDQHTLFNAFEDYEKFYFLGGSASWANIRAVLKHNIPELHIYEEGSYSADRVDVWGISDLHLLEEANAVFAGIVGRPFVAFVHLSGNHPPYNIPADDRGFEYASLSDGEVAKYGFESVQEYNSYRFMDHSIGIFFEQARREPYFERTLFVLYGDNGAPNSSVHQAAGERDLELTRYQTPLVIYSPGFVEPQIIDTVGSTVDVLPTIAGLLNLHGINTTIGRDLFDRRFEDDRYALTVHRQGTGHQLGLIGRDYYFLAGSDGSMPRLHRIYGTEPGENLLAEFPEVANQYETRLFAIYETAKYMRYHNQ